jgi:hypothetical protein
MNKPYDPLAEYRAELAERLRWEVSPSTIIDLVGLPYDSNRQNKQLVASERDRLVWLINGDLDILRESLERAGEHDEALELAYLLEERSRKRKQSLEEVAEIFVKNLNPDYARSATEDVLKTLWQRQSRFERFSRRKPRVQQLVKLALARMPDSTD